ncbi:MAG: 23S rRNA (adenine(2503)-C(2))-methyltransferase RlmN [Acidimicrobiia bacterium]|nr:23S rRNA (adenine(2503)-C(2))-methyltransferase RlmN [Acidimicrobiia bacterium]
MLYNTAPEELGSLLGDQPRYRADQVHRWLYEDFVLSTDEMTNLPTQLRNDLASKLWPFDVEITQEGDGGRTRKWLFRTPDHSSIESVLMGYDDRTTLCISSQAGCAMGCTFCATGQFGFERHLTAGEIVAQVAYANAHVRAHPLPDSPARVTNVVFMGMGEPLANYPRVVESLHRMIDIMDMAARSVTVSTVGAVPGMRRLAATPWQVGLAVSLHAADDDLRSKLVPLNNRYPLAEVIDACREYYDRKGRRVTIEWALMSGTNDSTDQARKLASIAMNLKAHVNVINLNPTPLTIEQPADRETLNRFMQVLRDEGANATLRATRGQDIDGACGQLRTRVEEVPLELQSSSGGT